MNCKICRSESKRFDKGQILNKYDIEYFQCSNCGFVQTEKPYWLEESYQEAISFSDVGLISRNLMFSKLSKIILSILVNKKSNFLDFGGGYGVFTRLMRDDGFNYYWYDKFAKNYFAAGFEGEILNKKYEAVTSFENFEHFENPLEDIEKIFTLTDFVLFSTDLISIPAPKINSWWYYCLEHGQHVSLFSKKSLEYIARKYEYKLISNNKNIHILSKKKFNSNIFIIEKIIRTLGFDRFLNQNSKTYTDMTKIISKFKKK